MDSLFHFMLAIIAGMAVGLHKKHSLRTIILIALIAVLIDVDHFILGGRSIFHNIWFIFVLPVALFFYFFKHEKKSIKRQSYSLILLAVLASHLVADLFTEGAVMLFWPLSMTAYAIPAWVITKLPISPYYTIISKEGIALTLGASIILLTHFTEDFIFFFRKKHLGLKKAIRKVKGELAF